MFEKPAKRGEGGFTIIEGLVVLVLLATVSLFIYPFLHELHARYRLVSIVRQITAMVQATRMQAIMACQNSILHVDTANSRVYSWVDSNGNFRQDLPTERTTHQYVIPPDIVYRQPPSGPVNGPDTVGFDTYNGDKSLVDLIVFRCDGTLVQPESPNSVPALKPKKYTATVPPGSANCHNSQQCRGIHIADRYRTGAIGQRNLFRITVDDFGRSGRISIGKWVPFKEGGNPGETDWVPPPWNWYHAFGGDR